MNVVQIADRPLGESELRRRRLAIQLAAQLPESTTEALAVLSLVEDLVRSFLVASGA